MPSHPWCLRKAQVAAALLLLSGNWFAPESRAATGAEPAESLPAIPDWTFTTSLSAAAGYRDNVLLSATNAVGSGLVRGEAEAMWLRLPTGEWDGYVFLNAIETRFLSAQQTDHERTIFLVGEVRWQPGDALQYSLLAQAYHHDQVFDVSTTESALDTAVLKMTGFSVAPGVRWKFAPHWWLEAKGVARDDRYDRDLDGYTDGEGRVRLGRTWGHGSEWSIGGSRRWRAHDSREQFTVAGRPITGTLLKARQAEVSAQLNWVLDAAKHWQITGTVLREENRDNGTGYFDYDRDLLTAGMTWTADQWEVRAALSWSEYEFPVQLVGIGITPEQRRKEETRVTVEVTRRLTASLAGFVFFESERSTSNDDRSRFRTNTGYVGLRWSWDQLARTIDAL